MLNTDWEFYVFKSCSVDCDSQSGARLGKDWCKKFGMHTVMHTTLAHCDTPNTCTNWCTQHFGTHTNVCDAHSDAPSNCTLLHTPHMAHTKVLMHTRLLLSVGFNARLTAAPLCTKALFHTFNQNFSYNDQNFSYNNQNVTFFFAAMHFATTLSPSLFTELIVVLTVTAGWCQFYWLVYCLLFVLMIFPDYAKPLLCSELVRSPIKWSDHWKTLQLLPKTFRGTTIFQMELFCMAWEIILSSQTVLLANWDAQ